MTSPLPRALRNVIAQLSLLVVAGCLMTVLNGCSTPNYINAIELGETRQIGSEDIAKLPPKLTIEKLFRTWGPAAGGKELIYQYRSKVDGVTLLVFAELNDEPSQHYKNESEHMGAGPVTQMVFATDGINSPSIVWKNEATPNIVKMTTIPHSEASLLPDGSLTIRYFNGSGCPIRCTVIAEGWSKNSEGEWSVDHSTVISHGMFVVDQRGSPESVGSNGFAKDTFLSMKQSYEKIICKVIVEWSYRPAPEWEKPYSVVSYTTIK